MHLEVITASVILADVLGAGQSVGALLGLVKLDIRSPDSADELDFRFLRSVRQIDSIKIVESRPGLDRKAGRLSGHHLLLEGCIILLGRLQANIHAYAKMFPQNEIAAEA